MRFELLCLTPFFSSLHSRTFNSQSDMGGIGFLTVWESPRAYNSGCQKLILIQVGVKVRPHTPTQRYGNQGAKTTGKAPLLMGTTDSGQDCLRAESQTQKSQLISALLSGLRSRPPGAEL